MFGNREAQARVNQAKAEKVFDDIMKGKVWKQQRNTGKTGNNAAMSITDKLGLDAEKERQDNENREAANYIDKKLADPKVLSRIREKHTPQEICEYLLEDYNRAILAISKQREIAIRKKEQLLIDSLGNILKNLTAKRFYRRRAFYERGFFENVRGLLRGNANGRKDSFLEGVLSPKWAESFRARFEDYIRALIPNDYRFQNDYVDKIEQELFEKEKERLKHSAKKQSAFSIEKKFSVTQKLTEPNDEKGRPRAMDDDGLSLYSRNNEPIYLNPEQRKEYDRKRKQVFDTAVDFVKKAGIKVVTDLKEVRKALSQNGLAEKYAVGTALTEETKQEIEALRKQYGDKVGIAPNGKKSNLTAYQWLLVRTKAFKKWFGDWEKAATAKIIKKLPAINLSLSNSKLSKKEAEAIFEGFGEQKNDRYGVTAAFTKNTVGKIIGHKSFDVTQIIEDLPRLFSSSILAYSNDEELKEGHKAHPNIAQYHNFVNKFTAEGKTYYIRFTMYETKVKRGSTDKRILHSTGISDIEIYNEKDAALQQDRVIYPAETITASFVDYKLSQFFNDVKNVSKVVDENGEPLVVYHGTPNVFDTFDIEKLGENTNNYGHVGAGFYFSDDKREAEGYGANLIAVFLNIRNPFTGTEAEMTKYKDILDLGRCAVDK